MTHKEHAIKIVNEFEKFSAYGMQKQCALFCIEGILSANPTKSVPNNWGGTMEDDSEYWIKIKKEIKKL